MVTLRLHTITISTRPGRVGPVFSEWFHGIAKEDGRFDARLVDLATFELPVFDEPRHPRMQQYEHAHTKAWSESVAAADAFVFVIPEYNFAVPPSFVNAISYLSIEWGYKPAGFVSYGGISGGMRSVQMAKQILTTLKVVPIPEAVAIPNFPQHLGEDRTFTPSELMIDGAKVMLAELHRWAGALKPLRG